MTQTASHNSTASRRFGASLRRLRERKGWSIEVFAKRLGVTPRRAAALEVGRGRVTLTDLVNIGEALGKRPAIVARPFDAKRRKAGAKRRRQRP